MSSNDDLKVHEFAIDDKEAAQKYEEYKLKDPFPKVRPALLNSNDIKRYVAATGMIHPFHPEPETKHLKQASYAIKMLGKCIYWDEEGKKHEKIIKEKQEFKLKGNSIAFISLEPRFRLPYYIALRFNLKIKHIHRGLLLGTGPLVDPGFNGKLAVPLHNLTMNDYYLRGGDDLIWFEFTKIDIDSSTITEFPSNKNIEDVNDYLHKAYHGKPVRSSLSNIQEIAQEANRRTKIIQWGGIISVVGFILPFLVAVFLLVTDTTNYIKGSKDKHIELLEQQKSRIESLENRVDSLKKIIENIEKNLDKKDKKSKVAELTKILPDTKTKNVN